MSNKSVSKAPAESKSSDSPKSSVKNSRKSAAAEKSPIKAVGYLRVSTGEQELGVSSHNRILLANSKA